jgi:hypothetical protein
MVVGGQTMNYFGHYSSRELRILDIWKERSGLIPPDSTIERHNTGFHDAKVILPNGTVFFVEVKEEEKSWYEKTRNIGLDYISAFNFANQQDEDRYLRQFDHRIPREQIQSFLNKIHVEKWGKLKTCDAHVHVFYVKDGVVNGREEPLLLKTYCNSWLKSEEFQRYLLSNYRLRINDKKRYGIEENWHSAAFFVKPEDPMLKKGEIERPEQLLECIQASTSANGL